MGEEEGGQRDPVRDTEHRTAEIRHQPPRPVFEGGDEFTFPVLAVPLGKPAVADVQRAFRITQIAQDVRSRLAAEKPVKITQDRLKFPVVTGIDSDKLPAAAARRVLGVAHMQRQAAAQEFE